MVEVFKHALGLCGEHWHPNIWTAFASAPIIAPAAYWIKCKCGGWFSKHKDECNHSDN
mgnify:FL=1